MATKQQRSFDIAEYADKVRAALKRLEQDQKPGQQSGTGTKTEVLQEAKADIVEMLKKNFTAKQIADAIKNDVFGILPKTITELAGSKAPNKTATRRATAKATSAVTGTVTRKATETKNTDATESTLNIEVNADKKNKTAAARNKPNNFVDI
jgi:non-homologous end joining protein Ku